MIKILNMVNVAARVSIETGIPQDQVLVLCQLVALLKTSEGGKFENALSNVLTDTIDIFAKKENASHRRYLRAIELIITAVQTWIDAVHATLSERTEEGEDVPRASVRWVSLDPGDGSPEEERGETDKDA